MNTQYKNAQFVQVSHPMVLAPTKPGRIEKKMVNAMDHFFTILLLISGEENSETVSIGHIL